MFHYLSLLSKATTEDFSEATLDYIFSRLYTEKLYCAERYRDSATFFLASERSIRRSLFDFDGSSLGESVGWQLRFMLAHELCHTAMRLEPQFRDEALRITQLFLASVDSVLDAGNRDRPLLMKDWLNSYAQPLAKNLGSEDLDFSWALKAMTDAYHHSDFDRERSATLGNASWLEEVTCDMQAALHLMGKMRDSAGLTKASVWVTMALQNLQTIGHFDFLARLPIDVFGETSEGEYEDVSITRSKEIVESSLRGRVVSLVMARDDWQKFRVVPPRKAAVPEARLLFSQWSAKRKDQKFSRERIQAMDSVRRRWTENVLSPMLLAYPAVAVATQEEILEASEREVLDLQSDSRKLRKAIDALYRHTE
jgi:hypothetical protein